LLLGIALFIFYRRKRRQSLQLNWFQRSFLRTLFLWSKS